MSVTLSVCLSHSLCLWWHRFHFLYIPHHSIRLWNPILFGRIFFLVYQHFCHRRRSDLRQRHTHTHIFSRWIYDAISFSIVNTVWQNLFSCTSRFFIIREHWTRSTLWHTHTHKPYFHKKTCVMTLENPLEENRKLYNFMIKFRNTSRIVVLDSYQYNKIYIIDANKWELK